MTGCGGNDSTAPDAPFDAAGTSVGHRRHRANRSTRRALDGFHGAMPVDQRLVGASRGGGRLRAAPSKLWRRARRAHGSTPAPCSQSYTVPTAACGRSGSRAWRSRRSISARPSSGTSRPLSTIPSDRTGAPANGVRFILYAVNPVSGQPVEPLVQIEATPTSRSLETSNSASRPDRGGLLRRDLPRLHRRRHGQRDVAATSTISGFREQRQGPGRFRSRQPITSNPTDIESTLDYELSRADPRRLPDGPRGERNIEHQRRRPSTLDLRGPQRHGDDRRHPGPATDATGTFNVAGERRSRSPRSRLTPAARRR